MSLCCRAKWFSYTYVYILSLFKHPPTPHPIRPLSVITQHPSERPVLHSDPLLASYFTHSSVYMSVLLSQSVSPSPSSSRISVFIHYRFLKLWLSTLTYFTGLGAHVVFCFLLIEGFSAVALFTFWMDSFKHSINRFLSSLFTYPNFCAILKICFFG